jgi:hypothetical protein
VLTLLHVLAELLQVIQMVLIHHQQKPALLLRELLALEQQLGHVILPQIAQISTILQEHVLLHLPLPHAVKMTMQGIA